MKSETKFFLGANSNIGFKSYFEQLQGQDNSLQLLILKGGAGSGKSSLMKRVMAYAQNLGHEIEAVHCASDPSSLDAFIDHTHKFAMMDGTAPHVTDPILPGVNDHIMYTGELWDCRKLRGRKNEIRPLAEKISDCHKSATAYIKASAELLSENMSHAQKFLNKEKLSSLADKIIKDALCDKKGSTQKRLLSAVSVGETVVFDKTLSSLCDRCIVLCDRWGAAADYVLKKVFSAMESHNQKVIYCPCSIMPEKCDHLIFPASRLAIVTQNDFLDFDGEKISLDEFYDEITLLPHLAQKIKLAKKILPHAQSAVKEAKLLHDELEKYYISAMDFSGMDALYEKILSLFYDQIM